MEWLAIIFLVFIGLIVVVAVRSKQPSELEQRWAEAEEAEELRKRKQDEFELELSQYINYLEAEGWKYIDKAKLMHKSGQPDCLFMVSGNGILRIDEYYQRDNLERCEPIYLNLRQILSLNTARPDITKSRKKTVPVSIVESKQKSPVARGLVGGALLGPAGVVIGAASGLNSKTTTTVENKTVYEDYDTKGDPQLIIGTTSADFPVLKVKFVSPDLADEWMFRIRALQATGCR